MLLFKLFLLLSKSVLLSLGVQLALSLVCERLVPQELLLSLLFKGLVLEFDHLNLPRLLRGRGFNLKPLPLASHLKLSSLLLRLPLFLLKLFSLAGQHVLLSALNLLYLPLLLKPFHLVFKLLLVVLLFKPGPALGVFLLHLALFAIHLPLLGL